MRQVSIREVSHLRLSMPPDDRWIQQVSWVPVSSSEYHLACRYFPFAMRIENQRLELGLLAHTRFLVSPLLDASGKWRGIYRPIGLRCYPFEAGHLGDDPLSDITIPESSEYLSRSEGIPFLDERGGPGKLVTELHRLLALLQRSGEIFSEALNNYLIADLLIPLTDTADDRASPPLYVIDRARFSQMNHAALGAMARRSFLSVDLAIAWAFSLNNLQASYLANERKRSHLQAVSSTQLISDSIPMEDLPLVLDDGELISLAEIEAVFSEHGQAH